MKKIISLLTAALLVFSLSACAGSESSNKSSEVSNASDTVSAVKLDATANIYGLKGPTGIGMVSLMDEADKGTAGMNYNITTVSSNDEIVSKLVNGEADIAAVSTNLASTLYKRLNGGISVLAVNTLGVLSIVTKGEEISDIASLKGKTVYSTGQGANPEYILDYILTKNGLKPGEDVKIEFLSQNEELVSKVVTGENVIVMAPQPVATTITVKDSNAKIAIDITSEWKKVSDTQLVMGCIVVRNDYLEKNAEAVEVFMKDYKASVDSVNSDIDAAAALCEKYELTASAAIAKKAIPYCNIVFEDGAEMKKDLGAYLDILYGYSPAAVGGALPESSFYYGAD